ncbi:MAG: hypothetical protein GX927_00690 [Lentisphaerae bacterium]|nr:hypothetical protein [Lentisphaerota bacterium]
MKLFFASLFLCVIPSFFAQPSLYLTSPIEEPIQIDGLSDDPAWAEAPIAGGFVSIRDSWPLEWTTVRAAYDKSALYLLAQGALLPGTAVTTRCQRHDDMGVFSDDSFEVSLAPEQIIKDGSMQVNTDTYFHLCFNLNGFCYSARKRDLSWQPQGILQKSSIRDRHWLMELRIPYAALETGRPLPGTRWLANFARNRPGSTADVSSWSGSRNFHDLATFGKLHFGVTPTWEPAVITLLDIRGSQIRSTIQLPLNPPEDLQAQILLDQAIVLASKGIDPLTPGFITFNESIRNTFLPLKGSSQIAFRVFSKSAQQVFLNREAAHLWHFQDVLTLDKYYYTPEDGKLEFSLLPQSSPGTGPVERLKISLLQECHLNSPAILSLDWNALSGSLMLNNLPFGTLYLRTSWEQSGTPYQTLRAFQYIPHARKAPPLPLNARLTTSGTRLLLDENPIFLVGASPTAKHFLQDQDCFNLAYGAYGQQQNAVRLESVRGASLLRKDGWVGYTFPPWEQLEELLQKQFQTPSPARNRFWRIAYEAQLGAAHKNADGTLTYLDSPQWYQKIYQKLKQISPDSLFSIQIDQLPVAAQFATHCDILEAAAWNSSYAVNMMPNLQSNISAIREACPDKPVLLWLGGTIPNNQCRTAEELRAATFQAVANGLAGVIIHMGHGFLPPERSRLWSLLSGLNAEIQPVFQAFQKAGLPIEYPFKTAPGFLLAARQNGSLLTVIAINQNSSVNTFPLPDKATVLLPFDNNRTLNRPEDAFSPYEAKVYQLHLNP